MQINRLGRQSLRIKKSDHIRIKAIIFYLFLYLNVIEVKKSYLLDGLLKSFFGRCLVAQLVGESSHTPKGCKFHPQSGHVPRLRV